MLKASEAAEYSSHILARKIAFHAAKLKRRYATVSTFTVSITINCDDEEGRSIGTTFPVVAQSPQALLLDFMRLSEEMTKEAQ